MIAEEKARQEKMKKEAEEAARLLSQEKELLRKAEDERQALQNKMDELKKQVEKKNKEDAKYSVGIAKNAIQAGLAGGFIGAVLLARVFLEDRDEVKSEAAAEAAAASVPKRVSNSFFVIVVVLMNPYPSIHP